MSRTLLQTTLWVVTVSLCLLAGWAALYLQTPHTVCQQKSNPTGWYVQVITPPELSLV